MGTLRSSLLPENVTLFIVVHVSISRAQCPSVVSGATTRNGPRTPAFARRNSRTEILCSRVRDYPVTTDTTLVCHTVFWPPLLCQEMGACHMTASVCWFTQTAHEQPCPKAWNQRNECCEQQLHSSHAHQAGSHHHANQKHEDSRLGSCASRAAAGHGTQVSGQC